MARRKLFVLPSRAVIEQATAILQRKSYALNNHYGKNPIAALKRRRFENALRLGVQYAPNAKRVIDMGAADGILIPSLAQLYEKVVAIDINPFYTECCRRLTRSLGLQNVEVVCNAEMTFEELHRYLGDGFHLMYLLETLEHVGSQPDIWSSKVHFLRGCFSLLESNGCIVVSVPKMVGLAMLIKNIVQRTMGYGYDPMTFRQLLKSALLKDTNELEPLWDGHHIGFNHLKLEPYLADEFEILERRELATSVFYVLKKR